MADFSCFFDATIYPEQGRLSILPLPKIESFRPVEVSKELLTIRLATKGIGQSSKNRPDDDPNNFNIDSHRVKDEGDETFFRLLHTL